MTTKHLSALTLRICSFMRTPCIIQKERILPNEIRKRTFCRREWLMPLFCPHSATISVMKVCRCVRVCLCSTSCMRARTPQLRTYTRCFVCLLSRSAHPALSLLPPFPVFFSTRYVDVAVGSSCCVHFCLVYSVSELDSNSFSFFSFEIVFGGVCSLPRVRCFGFLCIPKTWLRIIRVLFYLKFNKNNASMVIFASFQPCFLSVQSCKLFLYRSSSSSS